MSAALSKSAGLFNSPKIERRLPQGDETPLDFRFQKALFKIPKLADNLTSWEFVEFLFTRRRHVLTLQYLFYKSYSLFTSEMRLVFCACALRVGLL